MSWKYDLGPSSRTQQHLCTCSSDNCTLMCHIVRTESNRRMIFTLEQFQGMSCFEVGHVLLREGFFNCNTDMDARQKVSVRTCHPIWVRLREIYGLKDKKRKKRNMGDNMNSSDLSSGSEEEEE